jgi:hypothetical protein
MRIGSVIACRSAQAAALGQAPRSEREGRGRVGGERGERNAASQQVAATS